MPDPRRPKTALDRGPVERPIRLDPREGEWLDEAGGDTAGNEWDANVGGAPASAGLDSGGAVGVRRGVAVGRPGFEYDATPRGEVTADELTEQLSAELSEMTPEEQD